MIHYKRTTCRICGSTQLTQFLTLGPTPLANSFLKSPEEFALERSYPLDVYFCQNCSLVQLLDVIDPEVLFRDYIYVTGTSSTMAEHNRNYARQVVDRLNLSKQSLVVEIASNDGSLLQCFKERGVRTLGIEPATNIVEFARERGIETINQFFNSQIASQLVAHYGKAQAVIGNNVLAHVDDTRDFIDGFRQLVADDGLVIIEVPYLLDLIDRLEYDTIYHEHLCYFSVNALLHLCDEAGLSIFEIEKLPVHGGSLRMYAGNPQKFGDHSPQVRSWAELERSNGFTNFSRYQRFANQVYKNRQNLLSLLNSLRDEGKMLAGYGAPAKGNTLLNFCDIDTSLLPYTVDKNPMKVGLFTPGMHIPVLPVSTLVELQPDFVLILAWNFAEEIMFQQQEYLQKGGKFIIPVPIPKVV